MAAGVAGPASELVSDTWPANDVVTKPELLGQEAAADDGQFSDWSESEDGDEDLLVGEERPEDDEDVALEDEVVDALDWLDLREGASTWISNH